jgi:hypothetical protein
MLPISCGDDGDEVMMGHDHTTYPPTVGSHRHIHKARGILTLWTVELLRADLRQYIMNVARLNILIERGSYLREGLMKVFHALELN